MVKVIEILTQNIPEVKAIDLSSNKLMTIDSLMPLKHLNNLTILYLSDNKISDTRGLEKLKGEHNYLFVLLLIRVNSPNRFSLAEIYKILLWIPITLLVM